MRHWNPKPVVALLTLLLITAACTSADSPEGEAGSDFEPPTSGRFRQPVVVPEPEFGESGKGWFLKACSLPVKYLRRIQRGEYQDRGPDVGYLPRLPHNFGTLVSAQHTGPFNYLQQVPLVFFGPGHIKAQGHVSLDGEVTVADIAPTIAELVGATFPEGRRSRTLQEVLLPAEDRISPPRLVVVVVWDGGGWNTLRTWPEKWPFLRRMMRDGTTVTNATIGSSPSVTPPIHATIGTGTFPNQHGVVTLRIPEGGLMREIYEDESPRFLEATTLADEFDLQTGNRARIGLVGARDWHLGMIGHGAFIPGGDRDIAVLIDTGEKKGFYTNEEYYYLPPYLEDIRGLTKDIAAIDAGDGQRDGAWMGHDLRGSAGLFRSPAPDLFQTRVISTLLEREQFGQDDVPDLFFTNYKQIDHLGHFYNMLSKEVGESIMVADRSLKKLAGFLDSYVGADNWVLTLTADHGQSPHPTVTGGWPIDVEQMGRSIADEFDLPEDELIKEIRPNGVWLNRDVMTQAGIDDLEIVRFLLTYRVRDNVTRGRKVIEQFEDKLNEPLLAAVFPSDELLRVLRCAQRRAG